MAALPRSWFDPGSGRCWNLAVNVTMERNDDISNRVLELLGRKIGAGRPISLESSVIADTGLDSVSVMDFVMELEDEFDISIPLDQIAEVRTVGDLASAVRALSEGNAAGQARRPGEGP